MKTIQNAKKATRQYIDNCKYPTPRWAKILRNIGITVSAIGGGIIAAPALFPAALVSLGGYLVLGGTIATGIFQGFKKTQ